MSSDRRRHLVFFPGWGFSGDVIRYAGLPGQWWWPAAGCDAASMPAVLAAEMDGRGWDAVTLVGWSLGAVRALAFFAAHGARVQELYLLSLRRSWPRPDLDAIRRDLTSRPHVFMREFFRKCFLGNRKVARSFLDSLAGGFPEDRDVARLLDDLAALEETDRLVASFAAARQRCPRTRVVLVHGERDIVAPVTEMPELVDVEKRVIGNCGHAVFLAPAFRALLTGE